MGSSTQQQQQSSNTTPWAPQAGALTTAFDQAGNALTKSQQAQAPTDFTAQFTPDQLATFQSMLGYSNNNTGAQTAGATGSTLANSGTSAATGALTNLGSFDPTKQNNTGSLIDSANKFVAGQNIPAQVKAAMQGATEQARDVTMPGIEQNAAMTGNTNSSRTGIADGLVERGLAEQSANMNGALSGQAFANGLGLAENAAQSNNSDTLGALTGAANAGTNAANSGVNAISSGINDATNNFGISENAGLGEQTAKQADLTNQEQQYQSGVQSPFAALQQYMGIVGANNWGGNTNGTTNTTTTPSAWQVIGGLLGAGGNAANMVKTFSDRRIKTNVNRVGTLDNGLPVYTFQYIGHPQVHMGLMAQDVELLHPEAVEDFHSYKTVDYEMASA